MMYYIDTDLSLTEREEALRLTAYYDQGGVISNGYGHTGPDVYPGQVITRAQAVTWLKNDIASACNTVNANVTVGITQNQFNALVDFTYNVGGKAFRTSTLLKKLNAGDEAGADAAFDSWVFVRGTVNKGLQKRRDDEQAVFSSL